MIGHIIVRIIFYILVILLNLAWIALVIWFVITLLKWMGVL